jgi:hypothetical protein
MPPGTWILLGSQEQVAGGAMMTGVRRSSEGADQPLPPGTEGLCPAIVVVVVHNHTLTLSFLRGIQWSRRRYQHQPLVPDFSADSKGRG